MLAHTSARVMRGRHEKNVIEMRRPGDANRARGNVVNLDRLLCDGFVPCQVHIRHDVHRPVARQIVPTVRIADCRNAECAAGVQIVGFNRILRPDRRRNQHHVRIDLLQQRQHALDWRDSRLRSTATGPSAARVPIADRQSGVCTFALQIVRQIVLDAGDHSFRRRMSLAQIDAAIDHLPADTQTARPRLGGSGRSRS